MTCAWDVAIAFVVDVAVVGDGVAGNGGGVVVVVVVE